jgi:hypothetical protein
MRRLAFVLLLAGCPEPAPTMDMASSGQNPSQLWLGLDGSELHVKLVPSEPPPF